ncbi:translation initiation factor IF-2 N-terminal domain-containing protein [Corynebacterium sp. TA-R-1]|uniref:Translation initiation factor IF-2 N-terminal domain-containing protein n=1 Tax=Corynebacterium stercoris TaxID=2943490 RepID=A0ABT1FYQ1_9CORY|nr:translation initiation factor IF-2 N-terminal domain-containing protein [Corynebacterium stercoris]MCP1386894.1 translation initiation factor IF-2 N-terminal domain-containing protein [Corynebacterium stercoris]
MRVFQLAKELDVPSKDLVVALSELGIVKVAQSSLTLAESNQLLDALAETPAETEPEAEDAADEKIRARVRKDVANEITQIERKVDAELSDRADEGEDEADGEDDEDDEDTDALSDPEDLLTFIEPEVTPAPAEDAEDAPAYAPIFKAPSRSTRRRASRPSAAAEVEQDEPAETPEKPKRAPRVEVIEEPRAIKGSSRLEAQRRRRSEKREEDKKRSRIVSQAEFLARRESVTRTMVVRERDRHDGAGRITQVGVLEDGLLVEHFVTSDSQASMIGNIYLGRVQNVLPSMEAAFIDIGQGRNGVLYAGEVDWKAAGLGGRSRRIEHALKSGDQVVVQVTKDPVGHKGARLTTQISLAGRFLVYVPGGRSAGISRKLPAPERKRLKEILNNVVPGKGGAIIRTAAEGVSEEAIGADVNRLHSQWEAIQERAEKEKKSKHAKPVTLYEEPNLLVKVVRDLFNEDFSSLVVDGDKPWNTVHAYVSSVAPDLEDRLVRFNRGEHDGKDAFEVYRVDEQIQKALSRSVWLPSGGSLIIDRTEAMTVIDVNTGKFTGSGGSLEETVTSNNLEAAEEIVRQIRLRDIGGIIIIDFIDMILPENQDLVLRRLKEALGRDRTKHQVSEVTSLGLVQMTRKRLGTGLLEIFSEPCETCAGRGIIVTEDPVDHEEYAAAAQERSRKSRERNRPVGEHPAARAMRTHANDDELDEIAASIIVAAEEDVETEAEAPAEEREEKRSASRRRGRRGGSRGRGKRGEQQPEVIEPEEPREEEAPAQTFEEAVAEFEASPRRKRRTRGNSRSDHRPREEDFVVKQEPEVEAEPEVAAEPELEPELKPRKGRRRASRKSQPAEEQQREPKREPKREQQPADAARRGRRRATRRTSAN